jgi:hypothetical protein
MTASVTPPPTIYRLRLKSDFNSERDGIRHLKQLLKTLLRRHHFRAVSVEIEQEQDRRA